MPLFVSPVPDPLATAVDAQSLPWEDPDTYAFPPAAILGKVVEKLQDSPCKRQTDSAVPVVIPALAPTLDRSLKSDGSLFPVRALRYYLDRASDLRQNKEVVLSPLGKVSTKTPHLPLSPLGSSRL